MEAQKVIETMSELREVDTTLLPEELALLDNCQDLVMSGNELTPKQRAWLTDIWVKRCP